MVDNLVFEFRPQHGLWPNPKAQKERPFGFTNAFIKPTKGPATFDLGELGATRGEIHILLLVIVRFKLIVLPFQGFPGKSH